MKKQVLSSAILAALAINAHAALPTIDPATTSTLYISGASAQRGYIQQAIVGAGALAAADRICDSTKEIWQYNDASGTNWNAWLCTKSSANTGLNAAKASLLIHKRSAGGSDMGVAPVIANSAVGFLDLSTCTVSTQAVAGSVVGQATCTGTANTVVPDLGVSDVDPGQFVGKNISAGYAAVKASDLAKLKIQSTSSVVFGEQVTANLYKALQEAQKFTGQIPATCVTGDRTEACMPTLSSAVIANIHTGLVSDWNQIIVPGSATVAHPADYGLYDWTVAFAPTLAPFANAVHIVRRVNGSGTQTQHGIVFLNYPCDINAANATVAVNNAGQTEALDGFVVHEMSTAGNVNTVLAALDTKTANALLADPLSGATSTSYTDGVRWAVGLNSLEQKTSATTNYEFVKVDGVAPTLANVVAGKYHDWVENTFQYNLTHYAGLTADVKAVLDTIMTKTALPSVLSTMNNNLTHAFGNGAYLAHPSVAVPTTSYVSSKPVNVFSRQPNGTAIDNCRVPTVYNDGINIPNFGL